MASNFINSAKSKLEICDRSNVPSVSRKSRRSSSQPASKNRIAISSSSTTTTTTTKLTNSNFADQNSTKIQTSQKSSTNNTNFKSNFAQQQQQQTVSSNLSLPSLTINSTTTKPVARIRPRNEDDEKATNGIHQLRKLIKLRQSIEAFQRKKLDTLNADIAFYEKTVQSPKFQLELYQQQQSLALIAYYEKIVELQRRIREIYERLETLETASRDETEFQNRVFTLSNLSLFKFDPVLVLTTSTETRV